MDLLHQPLLGTAQYLACKLTACLQVGVENTFAAKVQMEKDLAATRDQVDVLTAERDSTLAAPLLHAKIKSLSQELQLAEGERLSAFDHMKEVEERPKVQAVELESCRSALEQERKKKSLAEETGEMDQVCHLNPAIDYSMITLDTRWDPKAKRIYHPKIESHERSEPMVKDQSEPVVKVQLGAGGQLEPPEEQVEGTVAGDGGECPT
ncbi:hypothetical protein PIB30_097515 [Stylosanthes scabra]|uniref:Uncharacterized protein n=1 Tax=Stylosanthes scabra TaxID=79078 RepID=A0ABU6WUH7_9FABA|nr:hypothetical protein [Stylosanthes scabra]